MLIVGLVLIVVFFLALFYGEDRGGPQQSPYYGNGGEPR